MNSRSEEGDGMRGCCPHGVPMLCECEQCENETSAAIEGAFAKVRAARAAKIRRYDANKKTFTKLDCTATEGCKSAEETVHED